MNEYESFKAYEELEEGLYLEHYGTPRHSGRYPWGSGKNPYQHDSEDWLARVEKLRSRKNMDDKQIAREMGCTINQLRAWESVAKNERKNAQITWCKKLASEGKSVAEIEQITGIKDRTVRNYLNSNRDVKPLQAQATAKFLEEQVDKKGYIDIGKGVEKDIVAVDGTLGITSNKLKEAMEIMKRDGYDIYTNLKVPQATNPKNMTTRVVACKFPEGMTTNEKYKELYKARDNGDIQSVAEYHSDDAGLTWNAPKPPVSIDSNRIKVVYAEDGGIEKDGVIEIRRGVADLSLGDSHYAQVRIAVDGTHYLKGMAVYRDGKDMPDGVDILFNTNKHSDKKMIDGDNGVLKPMKEDPAHKGKIDQSNPFGAVIMRGGQSDYEDPKTGEVKQSAINKIHDQGDWGEYSKDLPAQFLSKQNTDLIKKQLQYSINDMRNEFNDIMAIDNPTIRKYYLDKFASSCDSKAVHLKASALPRQQYQVILPVPSLKDNEIYAPNYRDGEQVALVRFPHGGTFEIPILTVNNKNPEAKKLLGTDPSDAVCINKNIADRLSGADFDGDTAIVIPTGRGNKVKITNSDPLKGLVGYDAKEEYATHVEEKNGKKVYVNKNGVVIKPMDERTTQIEMGKVTNLITDMTVAGAPLDDIAKAVRHSQTVIDAKKHHLDYKQSEIDNDIASLKVMYQRRIDENGDLHIGGASTLLSRAKHEKAYPETKGQVHYNQIGKPWYNPDLPEGALILKESGRTFEETKPVKDADGNVMYYEDTGKPIKAKTGKVKLATVDRPEMAMTNDARTLLSAIRSEPELLYADYANQLKALANESRKTIMYTKGLQYNPSARKEYAEEVASLKEKLDNAYRQKPKEARAQNIALGIINEKIKADPNLSKKDEKKIRQLAIETARSQVGVDRKDREITLTDREWAAIQAGAISDHILSEILNNTNPDSLRERATPSNNRALSESQMARIRNMHNGYYTIAEIADAMGVSTSTVSRVLKGA